MTYRHLQIATFLDNLPHLGNLPLILTKTHRQHHALALHIFEHRHHVVKRCRYAMTGNGNALESGSFLFRSLILRTAHTHTEKSVGPLALYLSEIVVLTTVNHLLHNYGRRHLGIIHITQEHLSRIPSVDHKGRQHLSLLTEEHRPRPVTSQCPYRLTIDHRVLSKPQMRMCIYNHNFFVVNS